MKDVNDGADIGQPDLAEVLKYSQLDMNRIKKEMELKWNACLLAKTKEWDKRDAALQMQNAELKKSQDDAIRLLDDYVNTISQVLSEKETIMATTKTAVKERDKAVEDTVSVEAALSALQLRFAKTKHILIAQKQNEESLTQAVSRCLAQSNTCDDFCKAVIHQADDKLDQAHAIIDDAKKSSAAEVAHLEAVLKKRNVVYQTLEKSHSQKITENKELVSICDELIAKIGENT